MLHKLTIDKLFNLGDYRNIHIISETSEITDEEWNDSDKMKVIRDDLALETYMNFVLSQNTSMLNANSIQEHRWGDVYENLKQERHKKSVVESIEIESQIETGDLIGDLT